MNTVRITNALAAVCLCILLASSPAAAQYQPPGAYSPQAAPYPYPFANGQPAVDWTAPPSSNDDFGGTLCGPHWYDAYAEAVYMTRSGSNNRELVTNGIRGLGPAEVVLSTDSADFGWETGVRVAVRFQLSAVSSIEATYLDALTMEGESRATSNNHSLYSLYSDFGNSPFGGYEDTDQASIVALAYENDLDVVEINCRHEWTTPAYRVNGSWLFGIRYSKLDERLQFNTQVLPHFDPINFVNRNAANSTNSVAAFNEMVGPQIGTTLVSCVKPGIFVEGKIKAGVLLDFAKQRSAFQSTTLTPAINENARDDDLAFVSEAGLQLIVQVHPLLKIRCGYELLFMDGIATAAGNLNGASPFLAGPRPVNINMESQALYHGGILGVELGW